MIDHALPRRSNPNARLALCRQVVEANIALEFCLIQDIARAVVWRRLARQGGLELPLDVGLVSWRGRASGDVCHGSIV